LSAADQRTVRNAGEPNISTISGFVVRTSNWRGTAVMVRSLWNRRRRTRMDRSVQFGQRAAADRSFDRWRRPLPFC
jgi:hypothetical protein